MEYQFKIADETMLDDIFNLVLERIEWMDKVGIKQWNVTNYTQAFPKSYYQNQIEDKNLFVMTLNGKVVGAVVLLEHDSCWQENDDHSAYYIHNLVTNTQIKGIGTMILKAVEELALKRNKTRLRLDCAENSAFLNDYYQSVGYSYAGKCSDGPYVGNKREKIIGRETKTVIGEMCRTDRDSLR